MVRGAEFRSGARFLDEADRVVRLIAANPEGFPVLHRDLRRAGSRADASPQIGGELSALSLALRACVGVQAFAPNARAEKSCKLIRQARRCGKLLPIVSQEGGRARLFDGAGRCGVNVERLRK